MRQLLFALPAALLLATISRPALAIYPELEREIYAGYCKNKAWPWPNICPDRVSARAPFALMVRNGWRRQNLLGEHHFEAGGDKLTRAGELKVHWVMTQAPRNFRQIFVERSIDPSVTSNRIATAEQYATRVALPGDTPEVHDTRLISEGRPADVVDYINVSFREAMPTPALPEGTAWGGIE